MQTIFVDINIFKGEFVIDKNVFTKMDTYCVIEIGKYSIKTKICISGGKNPVWN